MTDGGVSATADGICTDTARAAASNRDRLRNWVWRADAMTGPLSARTGRMAIQLPGCDPLPGWTRQQVPRRACLHGRNIATAPLKDIPICNVTDGAHEDEPDGLADTK